MHKLSDTKMGRFVARILGKEDLAITDGKVQLSDEEKETIKKQLGEKFLEKLEATTFGEESSSNSAVELFNAAVDSVAGMKLVEKDNIIKTLKEEKTKLQEEITALVSEPEPTPKPEPVAHAQQNSNVRTFAIDKNTNYNKAALAALAAGNPSINLAGGIDITDLKAEFKMSIPAGAKLDLFLQRIYNGFPDSVHMRKVLSHGRDYQGISSIISEVSQQFTPKWNPKGTVKFTPAKIEYRRHKINVPIVPAEVIDSWLIDLYEQGKTPSQQPLVLYIIENHILPKVAEDITFSMIAKGKYKKAELTDNQEGSAAVDSMDGFETQLVEGKKNGAKYNYFKNAVDIRTLFVKGREEELLDYVGKFAKAISPMFAAQNLPIFCSQATLDAVRAADYKVYGKYTGEEHGNTLRFSKFTLVPLESMYDSPILFATPKSNFVELVDLSHPENCINDIQTENYTVKIFGEYSLSTGFPIQEAVFASVPDGYTPSTSVVKEGSYGSEWEHGQQALASAAEPGIEGA